MLGDGRVAAVWEEAGRRAVDDDRLHELWGEYWVKFLALKGKARGGSPRSVGRGSACLCPSRTHYTGA